MTPKKPERSIWSRLAFTSAHVAVFFLFISEFSEFVLQRSNVAAHLRHVNDNTEREGHARAWAPMPSGAAAR